jgi:SAM-dependent methyltransferase
MVTDPRAIAWMTRSRAAMAGPPRAAYRLVRPELSKAYRFARREFSNLIFERGVVDTSTMIPLEQLGVAGCERTDYEPSGWLWLRRALPPRDVTPGDVFIDFGSGIGRVVYLAARHYPFSRVIGVEISETLNQMALRNIQATRQRLRCQNVELITADVMDFQVPDDVTVAYFYSPFRGDIFRHSIDEILKSIDRAPRVMRVVYASPRMEDHLDSTGRFRLLRKVPIQPRITLAHPRSPSISVYSVGAMEPRPVIP